VVLGFLGHAGKAEQAEPISDFTTVVAAIVPAVDVGDIRYSGD
jgi:hypothetical protein